MFTKRQLYNREVVLNHIYTHGPISRIDIANATGITPAKVSEITNNLMTEGIIIEIGELSTPNSKAGRKKILLDIKSDAAYYVGTELSQKFMSFALTDNLGNLYAKKVIPFDKKEDKQPVSRDQFLEVMKIFISENKKFPVQAVGIAIPGHHDQQNESIVTNNPLWKNFTFHRFEKVLGIPVFIENNVHCMAIAMKLFDRQKSCENFSFFHVGRGMFCSYINRGEVFAKDNFLVGEIGHTIVNPSGEQCECGKKGCLQTYASETWLLKKAELLYKNAETSFLRQLVSSADELEIKHLLSAYNLGDEGVRNIIHTALKYITISITNLSMIIDSNLIYLHGELFDDEAITNRLRVYIDSTKPVIPSIPPPKIIIREYNHINGAIGACALCVSHHLIKNQHYQSYNQ